MQFSSCYKSQIKAALMVDIIIQSLQIWPKYRVMGASTGKSQVGCDQQNLMSRKQQRRPTDLDCLMWFCPPKGLITQTSILEYESANL